MSSINGITILLAVIIAAIYIHMKGKIAELKKDIMYWKQGYTEVNTKLHKAEKIIIKLEELKNEKSV